MSHTAHITFNGLCGGNEWRIAASYAPGDVVLTLGDKFTRQWLAARVDDVRAVPSRRWFLPLNLSRELRHLPEGQWTLCCYRGVECEQMERAVALSGREDDFCLEVAPEQMEFPRVEANRESAPEQINLLWCGHITEHCGLRSLVEALASLADNPRWHLSVAGTGKARYAVPLLALTRKYQIAHRIAWLGFVDNVTPLICRADYGVITEAEPELRTIAMQYRAASLPIIASTHAAELAKIISRL